MENEPIVFNYTSSKKLQSFLQWHTDNQLPLEASEQNFEIFMERSFRTPMKPGVCVGWHIENTPNDYNGISKYMDAKSYAVIQYEGREERWPLTMLYFNTI